MAFFDPQPEFTLLYSTSQHIYVDNLFIVDFRASMPHTHNGPESFRNPGPHSPPVKFPSWLRLLSVAERSRKPALSEVEGSLLLGFVGAGVGEHELREPANVRASAR